VNYIIRQGKRKTERIRRLMEYSFDICSQYGDVFLSEDKKACALLVFPDKKRTSFQSVVSDIKLATACIGLSNIKKSLNREAKIKKTHPKESMYYLWFIGVDPEYQNKGIGSALLQDVITESIALQRPLYLETSTPKNIPWYKKLGFTVYQELDLGYNLFFLKKDL
jgi:ribosomal protein S18 acetylase RimI-like enzyme